MCEQHDTESLLLLLLQASVLEQQQRVLDHETDMKQRLFDSTIRVKQLERGMVLVRT